MDRISDPIEGIQALLSTSAFVNSLELAALSEAAYLKLQARQAIEAMAAVGVFGNSLNRFRQALWIAESAVEFSLHGDGTFRIGDLRDAPGAAEMGAIAPRGPGYSSPLQLAARFTLRDLCDAGVIVRTGYRYRLGELRDVLASL